MNKRIITFSAPGKIHLLGEHSVVYGKPALLATVDLRVFVTISANSSPSNTSGVGFDSPEVSEMVRKVIESIIKKHLKLKSLPPYQLNISSQLPIGSGLGSSAAISAAYIAALLTFLKAKWDLNLINQLTFEAEKVFHGNPSGADNSTIVFGGLIWFRRETPPASQVRALRAGPALNLIQPLNIKIPRSRNFVLVNTGKPKETTKEMVGLVNSKLNPSTAPRARTQSSKLRKIFDDQEQLTRELLSAIQQASGKELIRIIKAGERNLESIGVVSKQVISIIRNIEKSGGAAKICGGGGKSGPTGILLCYHSTPSVIEKVVKQNNLDYFKTRLGTEGLRKENPNIEYRNSKQY